MTTRTVVEQFRRFRRLRRTEGLRRLGYACLAQEIVARSGEWRYGEAHSASRCLSRSIASVEAGATSFRMAT